jgi:S-DNA-T family DNA segregation ATPase FtsK/SpoIIIE
MNHIFKKFKSDIVAISYLALGLFVALSLFSFNPTDPSFNSLGRTLVAKNYCGVFGSFLADLFYQFFGVSAWLFVAGFLRISLRTFQGENVQLKNIRSIWGAMLLITCCSLLSLYWPDIKLFNDQILMGGLLGLGFSQALLKAFNFIGVQVVLWSAFSILVVFYSERNVSEIFGFFQKLVTEFFATLKKSMTLPKLATEGVKAADYQAPKPKSDKQEPALLSRFFEKKNVSTEVVTTLANENEEDEFSNDEAAPFQSAKAIAAQQLEFNVAKRKVTLKAKPPRRIENWNMPKLSLLEDPPATRVRIDEREIKRKADLMVEKLRKFGVDGEVKDAKPGPLVTLYEFKPNDDVKISKIGELEEDLSLALSADSIRYVGQIPGRDVVGIETSNAKRETVFYKDLVAEEDFWRDDIILPMALGRQVNGEPKIVDLRKMPHMLIAGTTGSGKSVFVGSIITGLLFRHSPKTLKLVLIDPKMVDLAAFSKVPHMALPHITDSRKAVGALKWAVREMEKRYRSLSKFGIEKIEKFNEKIVKLSAEEIQEHEKINQELEMEARTRGETYHYQVLPYIVIIVDELADLMVVAKQDVEHPIQRLTQMARACGMHLIIATQSPRKDVVTGLIKTNIPGRIALKVASKTDSRIILDASGAERLLPNGDMLFLAPGVNTPQRHHGPFLKDVEIQAVVKFWAEQGEPEFDTMGLKILEGGDTTSSDAGGSMTEGFEEEEQDQMYDQILSWTSSQKEVSASLLQRKFRLGYPRAARLIEIFESQGVVSPANGSKPRQVLVNNLAER